MTTMYKRKLFTQRKSWDEILLPYAGGIFVAWCVVWLIVMSFDGVEK